MGTIRYFLRDALGIAASINKFSRQSDIFNIVSYSQTENVVSTIKTIKRDSRPDVAGLVLELYNKEFGIHPVKITGLPKYLDVAATITEDGKFLTISVINATDKDYTLNLDFLEGKIVSEGKKFIITGSDDLIYKDQNSENISIQEEVVNISGHSFVVPKESASIYKFGTKY
ncbi:hypothetical protein [Flavobacterium piscis]|uniref:Alpha-L-arabinofuranosidase n=1 Tax=Flavobacterium piscis TaxID=1114874 RepID=A0ABU1Y9W2_9FLAO|nr:hypothetical protein [Flavobacterium piscis]MDR7211026.1 alpha-L-arabinofuranosidase [Flavobacterium piscis]